MDIAHSNWRKPIISFVGAFRFGVMAVHIALYIFITNVLNNLNLAALFVDMGSHTDLSCKHVPIRITGGSWSRIVTGSTLRNRIEHLPDWLWRLVVNFIIFKGAFTAIISCDRLLMQVPLCNFIH